MSIRFGAKDGDSGDGGCPAWLWTTAPPASYRGPDDAGFLITGSELSADQAANAAEISFEGGSPVESDESTVFVPANVILSAADHLRMQMEVA